MSRPNATNPEWVADCLRMRGRLLTGQRAHWCHDWDGLPVDETTDEYECCNCYTTSVLPVYEP